MIESLAAGTPVIALRRGSVPEVIEDGVTGFICDDVDEMVEATQRIGEIDPEACRRHAARFSGEPMCRGYVASTKAWSAAARRDRRGWSRRTTSRPSD